MLRSIIGFEQDKEEHWVAWLDCAHTQHVRHDPPWTLCEWVTTEQGRMAHIGRQLDCKICDEIILEQRARNPIM